MKTHNVLFNYRLEIGLIILLITTNVLLRFPIVGHELGADSFFIHSLANHILINEGAEWLLSPLSYFGFYPLSYPSGNPHLLAIFSALSGINIEMSIFWTSLILGLLSAATSYILAGCFHNEIFFKGLVAFLYSTSGIILKFTNWTASGRGLFLVLIPLVIWLVFRFSEKRSTKYLLIIGIISLCLAADHRMFVYIVPYILVYFSSYFLYKHWKFFNAKYFSVFYLICITVLFIFSFFFHHYGWTLRYIEISGYNWYNYLFGTVFTISARFGFLLFFAVIGLILCTLKDEKSIPELFLLLSVLLFTPFLGHTMYFYQALTPVIVILAGFSIFWIVKKVNSSKKRQITIILILTLMISFSAMTLTVRYSNESNYLLDQTSAAGTYIGLDLNSRVYAPSGEYVRQISAITNYPLSDMEKINPENKIQNLNSIKLKRFPTSFQDFFRFVKSPFDGSVTICEDTRKKYTLLKIIENPEDHIEKDLVYANNLQNIWILK